jgi:hypothetical protein
MSRPRNLHFRDLPSHILGDDKPTDEFNQFMNSFVLPLITLTGYKLDEKKELATLAVQALIKTGLTDACVADSRGTGEPGARLRVRVWDAIEAAGLAKIALGSESSGRQTRYRASTRFLTLRRVWELRGGSVWRTNLERTTDSQQCFHVQGCCRRRFVRAVEVTTALSATMASAYVVGSGMSLTINTSSSPRFGL